MQKIKTSEEIIVVVFNHYLNCYEMTYGPECLTKIIEEVDNLSELNKYYELTVDGKELPWISLENGIMEDFVLDMICMMYEEKIRYP